jgi:hypothetical protein
MAIALPPPQKLAREISEYLADTDDYMQRTASAPSRTWFLVAGDRYIDLKAVWRQALGKDPLSRRFNTSQPVGGFPKLKADHPKLFSGIELIHLPDESSRIASLPTSAIEKHKKTESLIFVRHPGLARQRKERAGYRCEACNLKFDENYLGLGKAFLEAHHLRPLSFDQSERLTTIDDLIAICSNCHQMIHERIRQLGSVVSLADFKKLIVKAQP